MKNQIANALTVLRVLLVPVLVYLLLAGEHRAALWVFFAAGVSDALDGFIARHFNQFSRFGAILDPIADKSLIGATVLCLAWLGLLPLWLVLLVIARDLVILAGALSYRVVVGPFEMEPTFPGKLCTFSQLALLVAVLVHAAAYLDLAGVLPAAYVVVAAISVLSGLHYVWLWSRKAIAAKGGG
ncbi:MAG TPA: CDP-alcohol phosphatidyltransferase family protein [Burkholderiales bacterium]|nr:CDP-alcohol phosphatidyltransferase family protein [Burkholderiales bacterium]